MKRAASELLKSLPGRKTIEYPEGEPFIEAMAHGTMSVELYAPRVQDSQSPHSQDELYIVHTGTGVLVVDHERYEFEPGTCLFVAAGVEHRFVDFSSDFSTWVIFWGPQGGEA